jgi:protoporphyrinogen oxidase
MIDKYMSIIGTGVTILTIIGAFTYTQGTIATKMEIFENEVNNHTIKMNKNVDKIQKLEVSVAKIETKIDEGFKNLENFLIENY